VINSLLIVCLFQYTTVEMHLNSVERVQEYLEMAQEPPGIIEDSRPPMNVSTSIIFLELYTR
jgi:hypothetical protein